MRVQFWTKNPYLQNRVVTQWKLSGCTYFFVISSQIAQIYTENIIKSVQIAAANRL